MRRGRARLANTVITSTIMTLIFNVTIGKLLNMYAYH
jgi:hypothetical protein